MKELLIIKEKIKKFVGKNEVFILPILKFLLTFIALSKVNKDIGFMTKISGTPITLVVALAGSFLPLNLTLVILAVIIVAHVYALSLEVAIIVLALFLVMFLIYFRFSSKDSVAVLLTPLAFMFKVPYVIPVSMGLVGTPSSMVSVGFGVITYHVLNYIKVNAESLKNMGTENAQISAIKEVIDGMIINRGMILFTVAFAITVLVVYLIRRLSIPYCWQIAIGAGTLGCFVIMLIGNAALKAEVSMGGAFIGVIVSAILNIILQFFVFDLDYNHTEKVQFEDDEYYYYVKAVPKNTIKLSDRGKKKTAPVRKEVNHAPLQRETIEKRPVPQKTVARPAQSSAREEVRRTAATAAKAHTMNSVRDSKPQRPVREDDNLR